MEIFEPTTLEDACGLLAERQSAAAIAGGTALQMLRRRGEFETDTLVDLRHIPGLDEVAATDEGVNIGALVTHRRVELDPMVADVAPVLCTVASQIANVRVRNAATLGGNLAHRDHRLDPPGALMVLDAELDITSPRGRRTIPVAQLFQGFADKTIARDELITCVRVPRPPADARIAFKKFKSLGANDWPCASVAARLDTAGPRRRLRLGLTAVAPSPVHLTLDVAGLELDAACAAADSATVDAIAPVSDLRGGTAFKRRVARVTVADTIRQLWGHEAVAA